MPCEFDALGEYVFGVCVRQVNVDEVVFQSFWSGEPLSLQDDPGLLGRQVNASGKWRPQPRRDLRTELDLRY